MRHGRKNNHLGRKVGHRNLMLSNMACSLIEHKRINTTLAKAKVLRRYIEPMLTRSKQDTTHNRRLVFSELRNKYAVTELFREVSSKIADRPGGYTRIIKLGNRLGDNADMAMIELVDYNKVYDLNTEVKKVTRRSRAKKASSDKETSTTSPAEAPAKETKATEQNKPKLAAEKKAVKPSSAGAPKRTTVKKDGVPPSPKAFKKPTVPAPKRPNNTSKREK